MPKHILFVCIFNVKRSVVAHHMLRGMLEQEGGDNPEKIKVGSAGFVGREVAQWFETNSIPYPDPLFGRAPSNLIQTIMANRGFDLSHHRSRCVDRNILDNTNLIIPMLSVLKSDLVAAYPEVESKIVLPEELLGKDNDFLWEDTAAVPNDSRMFDYAHGNRNYVTTVINEIEDFLDQSFHQIIKRLFKGPVERM